LEGRPGSSNDYLRKRSSFVKKTKPTINYDKVVPNKRVKTSDVISNENMKLQQNDVSAEWSEEPVLIINSENCRVCLNEPTKGCKNLVSTFYDGLCYQEIYTKCTGRKFLISHMDYPMRICATCETELLTCYEFLQICSNTDAVLEKMHKTEAAENEPAEPEIELEPPIEECLEVIYGPDTTLKECDGSDLELLTEADLDDQINQQLETITTTRGTKSQEATVICHICGEMEKKSSKYFF
jgi:hypothetical protein